MAGTVLAGVAKTILFMKAFSDPCGGNSGGSGDSGSGMELVKRYTYDKKLIRDGVIQSFPAYKTSSLTIVNMDTIEQLTLDYANYYYFLIGRTLTTPIFNTNVKAAGRPEYNMSTYIGFPFYGPSDIPCISDPDKTADQSSVSLSKGIAEHVLVYWNSENTIQAVETQYGISQNMGVIQTATSNTLTVKNPAVIMRGFNTYFNQTYWEALTDVRCQYVIEVYRQLKQGISNSFWWNYDYIIDRIRTNNGALT